VRQIGGTQISLTSFVAASFDQDRKISMLSKLVFSAIVVAALFGTSAIASAKTQPVAAADSNAMASMRHHNMKSHHHMRYSRAAMDRSRPGGRPISRKPPS
jgi:hypothetical protein